MNVFRDPAQNESITLPWEGQGPKGRFFTGAQSRRTGQATKYSPVLREMAVKERGEEALKEPVY